MDANTVLDELHDLAKEAKEKGPDHGARANKAKGIITRYLKTPPTEEDKSTLRKNLTWLRDDHAAVKTEIYALKADVYGVALAHLDKEPEAPPLQPRGFGSRKGKPHIA